MTLPTSRGLPGSPHAEVHPALDRSWPADGIGPVSAIVAQLPDPAELPEGALLVVHESAKPADGLRRVAQGVATLWTGKRRAHVAVRCTALLARGYREIGAAVDPRSGEELTWGLAVTSSRSSSAP